MDTFAHGFWSLVIFRKKKYVWLAVLFGILPDLLSFGILLLIRLISGAGLGRGPPPIESLPNWIFIAYDLTHSFVIFIVVFVLLYFITKKWLWFMMGWPIHILIDIPTHSSRFFPTPFLWPISKFTFDGMSWGTSWFMFLNYFCLVAVFLIMFIQRNKNKK